jgi:hypothetical protein
MKALKFYFAIASLLPVLVLATPGVIANDEALANCELNLAVPIYDGQTWLGGCNIRMNGVVWPESGCPSVTRIHWDWGDGNENDQWFPGAHSYDSNANYIVTVTPYDAQGGSISDSIEINLDTCSPLGSVDPILYATNFQDFLYGEVNGQDNWIVGALSCPDCPHVSPLSGDGMIVDTGSGQKALEVIAAHDWGDEVGRYYSAASKDFVSISFDFQTLDDGQPFWFMDNNEHLVGQGVKSIYFWPDWVSSNASPGIGGVSHTRNAWHRTGIEINRQSSRITAYFFDGVWVADDDSNSTPVSSYHNLFYFRGIGTGERLWIDNLQISESDVPRSSRGATLELDSAIAALPTEVFVNENRQNALSNKLSAVFGLIDSGEFVEAYDKLQKDILGKTDGCVEGGAPDNNDWITECADQAYIYQLILDTMGFLETLD